MNIGESNVGGKKSKRVFFPDRWYTNRQRSIGIFIIIIEFYFLINNSIAVINKLLLIMIPYILFLKAIFCFIATKKGKNCLEAMKQKDKAAILGFLSFIFIFGSVGVSFFDVSKTMIISNEKIICIIVIGQIFYIASYLIGYRFHYKRVVWGLCINRDLAILGVYPMGRM